MRLKFHTGAVLVFIVMVLVMHEVHEQSHYLATWLSCGCHGSRLDMLIWNLCSDCSASQAFIITTFAGPFATYVFMWTGFFLLRRRNSIEKKCIGFVMITGSLPYPKLLAMLDHGGDEITAMRAIHQAQERFNGEAIIMGAIIILVLTLPPLWRAFRSIRNPQRVWIFSAILLLSSQINDLFYGELLNNWLAHHGILMKPVFAGLPLLIIVWDLVLIAAFLFSFKNFKYMVEDDRRNIKKQDWSAMSHF